MRVKTLWCNELSGGFRRATTLRINSLTGSGTTTEKLSHHPALDHCQVRTTKYDNPFAQDNCQHT